VPEVLVPVVERLAQNLFICASTVSQYAALVCFEDASIAEYERRRAEFKARRDWFIPQLNALGLNVPVMPDGAFYAFPNVSKITMDDKRLATFLLEEAGVGCLGGSCFGDAGRGYLRFSYAASSKDITSALARVAEALPKYRD